MWKMCQCAVRTCFSNSTNHVKEGICALKTTYLRNKHSSRNSERNSLFRAFNKNTSTCKSGTTSFLFPIKRIPKQQLRLGRVVGQGSCGRVCLCRSVIYLSGLGIDVVDKNEEGHDKRLIAIAITMDIHSKIRILLTLACRCSTASGMDSALQSKKCNTPCCMEAHCRNSKQLR